MIQTITDVTQDNVLHVASSAAAKRDERFLLQQKGTEPPHKWMWWVWNLLAHAAVFKGLKLSTWRVWNMSPRVWMLCFTDIEGCRQRGRCDWRSQPVLLTVHLTQHSRRLSQSTSFQAHSRFIKWHFAESGHDAVNCQTFWCTVSSIANIRKPVWMVCGGQCEDK